MVSAGRQALSLPSGRVALAGLEPLRAYLLYCTWYKGFTHGVLTIRPGANRITIGRSISSMYNTAHQRHLDHRCGRAGVKCKRPGAKIVPKFNAETQSTPPNKCTTGATPDRKFSNFQDSDCARISICRLRRPHSPRSISLDPFCELCNQFPSSPEPRAALNTPDRSKLQSFKASELRSYLSTPPNAEVDSYRRTPREPSEALDNKQPTIPSSQVFRLPLPTRPP